MPNLNLIVSRQDNRKLILYLLGNPKPWLKLTLRSSAHNSQNNNKIVLILLRDRNRNTRFHSSKLYVLKNAK
jgi:hypothetical protein